MDKIKFDGFKDPVFSVRRKTGRICNFDTLEEAQSYRLSFPVSERCSISIEVFEYGN